MEAILLCCCEPCLRGDDKSTEFYELLAIPQSASTDAVKTAYRRRALELHPDKLKQKGIQVTAEHNEEFNRLKDAYDVLSDPKRRRIYDRVGEAGLNMVEGKAGSDPMMFLRNLKKNKRAMFRIFLVITALFGLIVLQPVLFILKVDDSVSGSWFAIWTPMLVWDGFLLLNTFALLAMDSSAPEGEDPETWEDPYPITTRLWIALRHVVFIMVQMFILLRLDDVVHWSWAVTFIPWMLYEVCELIEHGVVAVTPVVKQEVSADVDTETGDAEEAFMKRAEAEMKYTQDVMQKYDAQMALLTALLRVLFMILLIEQLDNDADMNWGLVLLPVWLYFAFKTVFSCYLRQTAGRGLPDIDLEDMESMDPEVMLQLDRMRMLHSKGTSSLCMMILPLVTAILVAVYLEDTSTFDVAIIFVPFFVAVGLAYLIALCAFYAVVHMSDEADQQGGFSYAPPDDTRPSDEANSSTPLNARNSEHDAPTYNPAQNTDSIVVVPAPAPAAEDEQEESQNEQKHQTQAPAPAPAPAETHIDLEID